MLDKSNGQDYGAETSKNRNPDRDAHDFPSPILVDWFSIGHRRDASMRVWDSMSSVPASMPVHRWLAAEAVASTATSGSGHPEATAVGHHLWTTRHGCD